MQLPDVSTQQLPQYFSPINWVGMENIALPLQLNNKTILSTADIHINVPKENTKGIHMSRVFLQLQKLTDINANTIETQLRQIIATHQADNTNQARLTLHFKLPIQQYALKTPQISGWKYYPITIQAQLNAEELILCYTVDIEYSSTCPCSAALSRQIIKDQLIHDFTNADQINKSEIADWITQHASLATPHSQRSTAQVSITSKVDIDVYQLIQTIENTLQTATQTAVKRADEQAFAQRNGQNLMFVEDAARRIGHVLKNKYSLWHTKVTHYESLHSHNAVAYLDQTLT
ncbi:GTP cyclohydrolase FolE2 [Acinetobacter rathckeae]|uniref:GTP cyclohydrolase FolE2 n=1 Tax=Acinetobacter rathckeae TaxID=2605272 RepID=UPI0018A2E551|nr:GTP cyclohydrolase FolE2 [Acinetobacter rathckeae]MBF7687017.1 GTP cyclohydrolase I FolE2 [Acinetobacter rathckeae]MBF7694579.1 GTP cyclohydrolase I FolE2 [Acinetobacter rathckeae]